MVADNRAEALGPAERIINSLTQHVDHMVHNRPGLVTNGRGGPIGVQWQQATWVKEGDQKIVYTVRKVGKKQHKTRVGVGVAGTDEVREGGRLVGHFRNPGLFPEVVTYLYGQIAEVWKMDNEFAAKWASWAFKNEDNRDLKVLLAAFMLVQSRFGEMVEDGDDRFFDEDYRAVGEAMCLLRAGDKTFNPKLLRRIGEVLDLPGVAEINRKMGFGTSRRSLTGRYYKVIEKWLKQCELNPRMLDGLLKAGHRPHIMKLVTKVRYKPETDAFFAKLRWKQAQSRDGHRTVAIGKAVSKADSWEDLTEKQICQKIIKDRPSFKIVVGKLPSGLGITPAIMAAAVEAGSLSNNDLIIYTPTLEELGLLDKGDIYERWKAATEKAENQRAANIARNVRSEKAKEGLEKATDAAAAKAVEKVAKDLRIYVVVDKSGSMGPALVKAKEYLSKFVGAFPLDRLHVSVFNSGGREVEIKAPTSAAVAQAFRGHTAGGGTSYAAGVICLLAKYLPTPDEDAVFIFVGDEEDQHLDYLVEVFRQYAVKPAAFGLLHVGNANWMYRQYTQQWGGLSLINAAAAQLRIPCFKIDEGIFDDPYAVPRTMRNLIASTPVSKPVMPGQPVRRVSLVDQILKTDLLQKPAWA
ncbi:MAG: hypothetical protein GWN58_23235 [Anaerolineae bacterium]|nr:VWA domain-containing protein [Thermoplasmata archaeon]NIV32269.1 hypothetical protein [Anaerolineae bacterium]NIY03722.1 hypothetical protein [Thermoplasmata archaeon]